MQYFYKKGDYVTIRANLIIFVFFQVLLLFTTLVCGEVIITDSFSRILGFILLACTSVYILNLYSSSNNIYSLFKPEIIFAIPIIISLSLSLMKLSSLQSSLNLATISVFLGHSITICLLTYIGINFGSIFKLPINIKLNEKIKAIVLILIFIVYFFSFIIAFLNNSFRLIIWLRTGKYVSEVTYIGITQLIVATSWAPLLIFFKEYLIQKKQKIMKFILSIAILIFLSSLVSIIIRRMLYASIIGMVVIYLRLKVPKKKNFIMLVMIFIVLGLFVNGLLGYFRHKEIDYFLNQNYRYGLAKNFPSILAVPYMYIAMNPNNYQELYNTIGNKNGSLGLIFYPITKIISNDIINQRTSFLIQTNRIFSWKQLNAYPFFSETVLITGKLGSLLLTAFISLIGGVFFSLSKRGQFLISYASIVLCMIQAFFYNVFADPVIIYGIIFIFIFELLFSYNLSEQ